VLKQGERAGHWGVPAIRERAKRIRAMLHFGSEAGVGTEIELRVRPRRLINSNMREQADRIGAKQTVCSTVGAATEFGLTIARG
jgi:hypothetical protein